MSHLRTGRKDWTEAQEREQTEVLRVLLARAETFSWLIKERYWRALDQQSGKSGEALIEYYANPEIHRLIAEYLPHLVAVFGSAEVAKELMQRLPPSALRGSLALQEHRQILPRPAPPVDVMEQSTIPPRQQIDLIQMNSLCVRLAPSTRTTLAHRLAFRLDQHFFGRPLNKKIHFVVHGFSFHTQRLRRTIQSRTRTQPAPPGNPLLKVAVHGTGSLGDFFSHTIFIQEFNRKFGPLEIDFYAHPKKVDDAAFLFARTPFVKRVLNAVDLPVHRGIIMI